jgi:ribosomal protein S18 acetylase RimI-like enzyme
VDNIIRPIVAADLNSIKNILDSSELFPSELLDDMIAPYLNESGSGEIWFTYIHGNVPVGLGYCVPEQLTDGTYNLLAIAVDKKLQGKGIGSAMLAYLEHHLKEQQKRILIVETSSEEQFAQTRNFYAKAGYIIAGTIKDFWKEGDDKVIFLKKL